jgi:hypothetical protein
LAINRRLCWSRASFEDAALNYLIGPEGVILLIDLKTESLKEKLGQLFTR